MKSVRTRKMILEKAAPVFNRKGFDGTSLADLESATGLTKGALYGNFQDKETIAVEAFAYAIATVKERMRIALAPIPTFSGKLSAMLDFFARYVFDPPIPGGCPLLNTAVEADDERTIMRPRVASEIMDTVDFITGLLENGIRAGEFRKDTNARELAYIFFCAIEGAIMFSRVEGTGEPMQIIINHCKNKLELISICNKNE